MGCPSWVLLDDELVFSITTHDPDTGVATDADALPTYRIYEDETGTPILTGTMALLDAPGTVGFYTETIECTEVNGFENGQSYTVYIQATVDGDTGTISYTFNVWVSFLGIPTGGAGTAYATLAELKGHVGISGTVDDTWLTQLLVAASRAIDRLCNRLRGFAADDDATTREYSGNNKPYIRIDECVEVTLLEVKDSPTSSYTAWGPGDWIPASGDPKFPNFDDLPYDMLIVDPTGDESVFYSGRYTGRGGFQPISTYGHGTPTVRVTARWGFADADDIPQPIKIATVMQAARWYKRLHGGMSDALASGELGQLMFVNKLDPDVQMLLIDGRYFKPAIG